MEAVVAVEMPASDARERLLGFVGEMAAGLGHPRRCENALVYVRGLVEHGGRKSLQPTLFRLGGDGAQYESLQQFLADSPWDPSLLVRACAERVGRELAAVAWIVDDTAIPKDGKHSPGVKRQYSGTLGKIGNCQITVSLHAVGERGSLPLGFALYLPQEWCDDPERRQKAKIPDEVGFQTKPQLARALACGRRAGRSSPARFWPTAPTATTATSAALSMRKGLPTWSPSRPRSGFSTPRQALRCRSERGDAVARHCRPSRPETRVGARACPAPGPGCLAAASLPHHTGRGGDLEPLRLRARRRRPPRPARPRASREEWLVIEWRQGEEAPCDYWLSNLPADTSRERLARLARLRWTVELDYRQLKGELGLDHYEGRSYLGFHHHCALVSCAHAFLTLERLCPKAPRPA